MKVCTECGKNKPVSCFYLHRGGKLKAACKECSNKRVKDYHANNPDRLKTYKRKTYEKLKIKSPEKIKTRWQNYFLKNRDLINKKGASIQRYNVEVLHDSYIIKIIRQNIDLSREDVLKHPDLIETQRLIIKVKRLTKKKK